MTRGAPPAGVRVVEIVGPGPPAAMILADLGVRDDLAHVLGQWKTPPSTPSELL